MKTKYEPGDECWIACGLGADRLLEGKVLYELDIPGDCRANYLIEVRTPVDPFYEVRDAMTMSAHGPKGPLGIWDRENRKLG